MNNKLCIIMIAALTILWSCSSSDTSNSNKKTQRVHFTPPEFFFLNKVAGPGDCSAGHSSG